ncbi:hypothetical protein MCOR02_003804 [Pyricularia oryzae]|nr:hypothetical protein MCOR01_005632 [Pyricularia oryzae]KAH9434840.1 hypothetical protein MCOR02_003804 [Pyricularia oryzae]KAI6255705.1 hypothetical protein MCOR19_007804 [Pyricularia oryzae]KAI6404011.1 hypothetical protein MCOR20_007101 [Pyricularia oryzae]KAI6592288.1 hypothetical protein MCOR06_004242 [Pyricularia oryzae]
MANNSGVCRLQDDASEHQRYVAQILDPLYYNFTDNLSSARTLGTYACMPTRITPWRRQRTSSQEIQTSQSILCRRTTARGHLRCRWTFPSRTGARYATSGWCGSRSSYSSRNIRPESPDQRPSLALPSASPVLGRRVAMHRGPLAKI